MSLLTPNFYHVAYESAPPLLRGTSLRTLSAEEMTESAELVLDAARQQNCPFWLLDGRRHGHPQPLTLQHWMLEEYFPRVRAELGRQPCVAFLALPTGQQKADRDKAALREWQTPAVRIDWFTDEAPALAWLSRFRS